MVRQFAASVIFFPINVYLIRVPSSPFPQDLRSSHQECSSLNTNPGLKLFYYRNMF